jgi:thiol-disulfide isomerase/thioredoxin
MRLLRCLRALTLLLLAAVSFAACAGMPPAYAPVVIEPVMNQERAEFDLNPALARARREGKWLYVYLGASDCPFCRRYETFLAQNAAELVPHFAKQYLVVDLRSELSIRAKFLYLKLGATSLPYAEFQTSLGDERVRMLVYPSVWLLDGTPKPLMQMPAGTGTFQTVPEQLEILRLEQ